MPDSKPNPDIFGALPDEPEIVRVDEKNTPVPEGARTTSSHVANTSASPADVLSGLPEPEVEVSLGPVGKRYALLVGVNKYELAEMPPLKYAVSDVEALQGKLTEYGFEVTCLHDRTAKKPSRGNVLGELARIIAISQPEDLVLVHFSCHGKARDGQNYLLLADTYLGESLPETALSVEKVKDIMSHEGKARRLMLMLDACQSGSGGREVVDAQDHSAFLETAVQGNAGAGKPLDKSLSMRDAYLHSEGFAVLAGCDSRQIAHEPDELGHGVFTHFILQALDAESTVVDAETQLLTSDRLATYVERGVAEWWRTRGIDPQKPVRGNDASLALVDLTLAQARPVPADALVTPRWDKVVGPARATLKQVSVGNAGSIWGLDTDGCLWKWNGKAWVKLEGGRVATIAAASDGTVWATNPSDSLRVLKWDPVGNTWTWNLPTGMKQVTAVNATTVYGLDTEGVLFALTGSTWTRLACCVSQISVGADGELWATNPPDALRVLRWSGTQWTWDIPTGMRYVSVGNAQNIWALDVSDQVFKWNGSGWTQMPGELRHISVAGDGTVWGLNAAGAVYKWVP